MFCPSLLADARCPWFFKVKLRQCKRKTCADQPREVGCFWRSTRSGCFMDLSFCKGNLPKSMKAPRAPWGQKERRLKRWSSLGPLRLVMISLGTCCLLLKGWPIYTILTDKIAQVAHQDGFADRIGVQSLRVLQSRTLLSASIVGQRASAQPSGRQRVFMESEPFVEKGRGSTFVSRR